MGMLRLFSIQTAGVGTVMQNEGLLNPAHILEALEAQGIIQKVSV